MAASDPLFDLGRENSPVLGVLPRAAQGRLRMIAGYLGPSLTEDHRRGRPRVPAVRTHRTDQRRIATRDAALARMREAKLVEARTVRADGTARANAVRSEGDAQIAQIERDSFGRDPQFYAFYRALQSYETTFRSEGSGRTTWALPATEGYLRHFERDAR